SYRAAIRPSAPSGWTNDRHSISSPARAGSWFQRKTCLHSARVRGSTRWRSIARCCACSGVLDELLQVYRGGDPEDLCRTGQPNRHKPACRGWRDIFREVPANSNLEENLPAIKPVADVPQQREHQHLLRYRPEIAQELEIVGKVLQPAIQPAFDADLP